MPTSKKTSTNQATILFVKALKFFQQSKRITWGKNDIIKELVRLHDEIIEECSRRDDIRVLWRD